MMFSVIRRDPLFGEVFPLSKACSQDPPTVHSSVNLKLRATHPWGFIFSTYFLFCHKFLFFNSNSPKIIYIYIYSKVGEFSRGYPEGSLFNSRGVGEGATPFSGLLHFTLDPYLIMLCAKQGGTKYHFWVFGMTRSGIEPWSPEPLANTLLSRQITLWYIIFFFIINSKTL